MSYIPVTAIGKIAEEIAHVPEYSKFYEYCQMKNGGLEKLASVPLSQFIEQAKKWTFEAKKRFFMTMQEIFTRHNGFEASPYQLEQELKIPMLKEWIEKEPENPDPLCWYGSETGSVPHINKALELDPNHQQSILTLVQRYLDRLWTGAHRLPSHYLGCPDKDLAIAKRAQSLLNKLEFTEIKNAIQRELNECLAILQNYLTWKETSYTDFITWGRANNKLIASDHFYGELQKCYAS